jgi:4-hydroxy-4-methyl-2-oxoglutarate aldolase
VTTASSLKETVHPYTSLPGLDCLSSATLHEAAGRIGALPGAIKPIRPGMRVVGPAYPISGVVGDNLWLHRAIAEARPGDVLVAAVAGDDAPDYGYWGEVLAVAAQARGIAGLVIDGGVRDVVQLEERGFPVFARGLCIRGTEKDPAAPSTHGSPVRFGGVTVRAGDLVLGDDDGVVVIPQDRAGAAVEAGVRRDADENDIFARLLAGETTLAIYGLPGKDA